MRLTFASLVVTLAFCILPYRSLANDYAENQKTLVMNKEVPVCWSISNLEQYTDEYLFIYDYSSSTGSRLGTPWVLPRQGVCYATDFTEKLYAFKKPISPMVATLIESTGVTPPHTNIPDVVGEADHFADRSEAYGQYQTLNGLSAPAVVLTALYYSTEQMVHMMPFKIQDVLPTRYIPGEGIAGYGLFFDPTAPLFADVGFIEAKDIIERLALELGATIAQCDTRSAVEVRSSVEFPQGMTSRISGVTDEDAPTNLYVDGGDVWHTKDYGAIFGANGLLAIEVIGCTDAVQSFLQVHKKDVQRFDELMMRLERIYGGQTYRLDQLMEVRYSFFKRDTQTYADLFAFAYLDKVPEVSPEQLKSAPRIANVVQEVGPVATSSTPASTASTSTAGELDDTHLVPTSDTSISEEQPAIEQAPDGTLQRSVGEKRLNTASVLYFVALPLLGFIGMLFLSTRMRSGRKDDKEGKIE